MSVVTKLNHGLGNKLFKLIHSLIVGEQYRRKVYIYNHISKHEQDEKYAIEEYFPNIKRAINQISEEEYISYENKYPYLMDEEICFAKISSDIVLTKGYMMIKYYLLNQEWRKWILNMFKTSKPIETIKTIKTPSIGIHIRVGDYLNYDGKNKMFPLYHPNYYLDIIKKYPNHTIYFFTDTGEKFIKNNIIPKIKNKYNFIKGSAIDDLLLLSKCDILILSASTFSFWAAYLNNGNVYCPKYFLMIKLQLENWTIIDTDTYPLDAHKLYY